MELINYIEDTHILYDNPYYHSFEYNKDDFINMITEGIKSPILLGKPGGGNNGKFYVSLSKHENCEYSIYDKLNSNPMFVIDRNLKTLKTRNFIKKDTILYHLCNLHYLLENLNMMMNTKNF